MQRIEGKNLDKIGKDKEHQAVILDRVCVMNPIWMAEEEEEHQVPRSRMRTIEL